MANNTDVLLDIKFDSSQAIQNIKDLTDANAKLKGELKDLKETDEDYFKKKVEINAQIKENSSGIRENTKEIQAQKAAIGAAETSINGMRARVADLSAAYNSMSKEMRESEAGQRVAGEMATLNKSINEANSSVNNFKDNIGNYPEVMNSAIVSNSKLGQTMNLLGISAGTTADAFGKTMVTSLQAVGKQMLTLMANPLIAGLAAIVGVIMLIVGAIKKSDAAMTALQVAMDPVTELMDFLVSLVGKLAEGIASAVEWIATLGGTTETTGQKAVRQMDELEEIRRKNMVQSAKDEAELAKQREIAADKENYSAEQRKAALLEAKKIKERELLAKAKELELEKEQYKNENYQNNKTDEYADEMAKKEAAIINLKTEQAELNRSLLKGIQGINKELEAQAEAEEKAKQEAIKKYQETQAKRKQLVIETERQIEDLTLAIMKDGQEKEIAAEKLANERKIEELRNKLATDVNLTAESRANLRKIIELQEEQSAQKLLEINKKYEDAKLAQEAESRRLKKEGDDAANAEMTAYELKRRADEAALKLEQRKIELQNEIDFEAEQAQAENQRLLDLKKEGNEALLDAEFETMEAYELAVLKSNQRVKESNDSVVKSQKTQQMALVQAIGSIAGSMSDLFGSIAGDSKALAGFQKTMGMVEILTNMATGISGAITAGAGLPFPANLGAIASGVGSVVAGITSAIGIFSQGNEPEVPSRLNDTKGGGGGSVPTMSMPSITVPTLAANPTLANQAAQPAESSATTTGAMAMAASNQPQQAVLVTDIIQGIKSAEIKDNLSRR